MKLQNENEVRTAPYGSWISPISSELVVENTVGFSSIQIDHGAVYWIESRPSDNGRRVVVRRTQSGLQEDIIHSPYSARSRVHEYGGGEYVVANGVVYFSNQADGGLYEVGAGSEPRLIVNRPGLRFADMIYDSDRHALIAICEDHNDGSGEPINSIVRICILDGSLVTLVSGESFYSSVRLSPDRRSIAWLCWNHPNMPWDGTDLFLADIDSDGALSNARTLAGGDQESIFQPEWSPDGQLWFVSDRSGWWNLYRQTAQKVEAVWEKDAEFGLPQWVFGQSTYAFVDESTVFCTFCESGRWKAAKIHCQSLAHEEISIPFSTIDSVAAFCGKAYIVSGSPIRESELVELNVATGTITTLKSSSSLTIEERYISVPAQIEFATLDKKTAFAIYYPPRNDDFKSHDGELPPLLVACHSGPTSSAFVQFNRTIQFWTSRGFAYIQVNYSGSTGYGREYRERLTGKWGIADVRDCVAAAVHFAEASVVDLSRMMVHGGSAGGYTALMALIQSDVFAAGAGLYAVCDLESLALDTHKFESYYLDRLVGKYPERKDVYFERSPVNLANRITSPVILFQGLDDKVVPSNQSEQMVEALIANKIPVAYLPFEGEGHGFRKSSTIKRCIEAMLYFYCKVLKIEIADYIEPVEIVGESEI